MSGSTRKLIPPSLGGFDRASARQAPPPPSAYEAYYGLVEPPFSLTPGLRFAFNSRSHATALAQVRQALERREGLIVVTGEVGTGKTMLCRALTQDANPSAFVSLVLDPCLAAEEILEHVLTDFGVMNEEVGSFGRLAPQVPRHQMLILLQRFLASLIPLGGRAVVVIDEAQHLRPEVLEQIRLWSNFETNDTKLLQIVLAGQSELDDILRRPEMRQIQQRVSRRCELTPLSREEVGEYIDHRLWVARGFVLDPPTPAASAGQVTHVERPPVRFTPAASRTVAAISGGIPRLVNLLCDRSLEAGSEERVDDIDRRQVEAAARRLDLAAPASPEPEVTTRMWRVPGIPQPSRRTALAAAALLILGAAPWVWRALPLTAAAPPGAVRPVTQAAAPQAAETLPMQDMLRVTVATFGSEARTRAVAASLTADGYPALMRKEPGSASYRLIVGPYVSPDAADAARRALAAHGADGIEMRLNNEHAEFSADMRYAKEPARPVRPIPAAPKPAAGEPPAPAADAAPTTGAYQAIVHTAIERLERLAPFLVSATTAPSGPVLKALDDTLATLGESVATVEVPVESRRAHDLLTSAISVARTAVRAGYDGDRVAQTREALALLDQAKAEL